jgi:hypothetical protein
MSNYVPQRENNSWGGSRAGAGRKRSPGKVAKEGRKVYLSEADWAYLVTFNPGNASAQVGELIERARKFWSVG